MIEYGLDARTQCTQKLIFVADIFIRDELFHLLLTEATDTTSSVKRMKKMRYVRT